MITALLCATIGTLFGSVQLAGRTTPWLSTTAALCAAQLIGHVALALAGGHHHSGSGLLPGPTMAAFHIGAAIVLGTAIAAVEYLYVVCASVLCWLRLFSLRGARPAARAVRCSTKIVVVQPVLVTGLGMRAPPRRPATA
ncbi:hypothetical protein [Mycolicibacterium sp.]|uniref:hypothetical protein n=1 Tax=Mycolicibacterium sp. TaxID=2320850 RepID=UPI003D0FD17E